MILIVMNIGADRPEACRLGLSGVRHVAQRSPLLTRVCKREPLGVGGSCHSFGLCRATCVFVHRLPPCHVSRISPARIHSKY